jgi:hypothetical protein
MNRAARMALIATIGVASASCQNPSSASSVADYSTALDLSVSPDPIIADTETKGKTYRVVRGNNQPDDIVRYEWHAMFSTTLTANNNTTKEELNLDYPIRITAATVEVKQATGGIITPPSGSDKETYEYVPLAASGNQFGAVGSSVNMDFEVWYHLPSLRKESVMTLSFGFVDNDGTTFQRSLDFKVAP